MRANTFLVPIQFCTYSKSWSYQNLLLAAIQIVTSKAVHPDLLLCLQIGHVTDVLVSPPSLPCSPTYTSTHFSPSLAT
jgi:hypothetical protein